MSNGVGRSIRAGLSLWELPSPVVDDPRLQERAPVVSLQSTSAVASVSQPSGVEPTMPGPELPIHRRIGRRVLGLLRPLAAPFLYRLDLRITAALDRSSIAGTLGAIDARLAHLTAELNGIRDMAAPRVGFEPTNATISQSLIEIDIAIKSINRQLSETGGHWLDERIRERMAALHAELGETTAGWAKTAAGLETQSESFVRYAEKLLQRMVLPLGPDLAVRTEAGYLLVPAEDPALLVAVVETRGRLEPGTQAIVSDLLHEGGVFIDVGANIGTFTLPNARRVGQRGHVLALEPAPRAAALLRRTVALNELSAWVEVQECAAGEIDGTARFALSDQTTHNSFFDGGDTVAAVEVSIRRLDNLVAVGHRVDVVKIDVEGAELQVWRGMQRIVAENPALAIILEFAPEHVRRAGVTIAAYFAALTSMGHVPWEIDEATGLVSPLRRDGLENVYTLNVLLLRDRPESRGLRLA